jgi:hypothetical protein
MANYRNEIISELKPVWDWRISGIGGITLVLCGSIASFMINKVVKSNAFYGRSDLVIHLKNFLLPDTKTIQKVLISRSNPTSNLASSGYFYKIIKPEEFF